MKIAAYNGFPFHYEMFGYVIDYCVDKNIELTIYTTSDNNMDWLKFYLDTYGSCFKLKNNKSFQIENEYDKIILLTDDDKSFKDEWIKILGPKMICVDHDKMNRRDSIETHIGTRFLINRPCLDWVLPIYRMIDTETKKSISTKTVIVIGNVNTRYFKLKQFEDFENINFILIDRYLNINGYNGYKNVSCYNSISTIDMLNTIKCSDYIYISDNEDFISSKISSSIPLGLD